MATPHVTENLSHVPCDFQTYPGANFVALYVAICQLIHRHVLVAAALESRVHIHAPTDLPIVSTGKKDLGVS